MPPLIGTKGAASAQGFGWTVNPISGVGGWIARTEENFGSDNFRIYGESTNGIFFCGSESSSTIGRIGLLSFGGTLTRQFNFRNVQCCVEPSGSTSMIAALPSGVSYTGASTNAFGEFILKLTSSNTYFNGWRVASPGLLSFNDLQTRTDGSAIMGGNVGGNNFTIHVTDANLASWEQSVLLTASGMNYLAGIALDSSQNVILALSSTGNAHTRIFKILNTAPFLRNFDWSREISAGSFVKANSVVVDSSNNIYVLGLVASSPAFAIVYKFDSSGTFQWGRQIDINNSSTAQRNNRLLSLDSSGNLYVMWYGSGSANNTILKYNSSGTLQWQRQIRTVSGSFNLQPRGVYVSGDYMYLAFSLPVVNNPFIWKLPTDGRGMGSYTITSPSYTFAYEESSYTDASYSPIVSNLSAPGTSNTGNTPQTYTPNSTNTNQNTWSRTII